MFRNRIYRLLIAEKPYYHVSDVKQSGNVSNDPITNPLHFFTSGGPEKLEDSCKCI